MADVIIGSVQDAGVAAWLMQLGSVLHVQDAGVPA